MLANDNFGFTDVTNRCDGNRHRRRVLQVCLDSRRVQALVGSCMVPVGLDPINGVTTSNGAQLDQPPRRHGIVDWFDWLIQTSPG